MHFLQQGHLGPPKLVDVNVNVYQIIKTRRLHVPHLNRSHDKQHTIALLQFPLVESEMAQPFRADALKVIQVRSVVNDFTGVGILKINPDINRERDFRPPATIRRWKAQFDRRR